MKFDIVLRRDEVSEVNSHAIQPPLLLLKMADDELAQVCCLTSDREKDSDPVYRSEPLGLRNSSNREGQATKVPMTKIQNGRIRRTSPKSI